MVVRLSLIFKISKQFLLRILGKIGIVAKTQAVHLENLSKILQLLKKILLNNNHSKNFKTRIQLKQNLRDK